MATMLGSRRVPLPAAAGSLSQGCWFGCRLFRTFPKGAENNRVPQTKKKKKQGTTHALQKNPKKQTNKKHQKHTRGIVTEGEQNSGKQ